jgi:hypothetical protein
MGLQDKPAEIGNDPRRGPSRGLSTWHPAADRGQGGNHQSTHRSGSQRASRLIYLSDSTGCRSFMTSSLVGHLSHYGLPKWFRDRVSATA